LTIYDMMNILAILQVYCDFNIFSKGYDYVLCH